ncbi:hypothetical protein OROGR_018502 [Orobanche gracilis]
MKKTQSTIHGFFKRKYVGSSSSQDAEETTNRNDNIPPRSVLVTENPCKKPQMNSNDIDLSVLEGDPGLRHQVYDDPPYEATSSRKNRSLAKELMTGAVASVFLGFGSLFLLLSSGVYV